MGNKRKLRDSSLDKSVTSSESDSSDSSIDRKDLKNFKLKQKIKKLTSSNRIDKSLERNSPKRKRTGYKHRNRSSRPSLSPSSSRERNSDESPVSVNRKLLRRRRIIYDSSSESESK